MFCEKQLSTNHTQQNFKSMRFFSWFVINQHIWYPDKCVNFVWYQYKQDTFFELLCCGKFPVEPGPAFRCCTVSGTECSERALKIVCIVFL